MGRLGIVLLFVVSTFSAAVLGAVGKDAWEIVKQRWASSPSTAIKKQDRILANDVGGDGGVGCCNGPSTAANKVKAKQAAAPSSKKDGGDGCCGSATDGYQVRGSVTDGYQAQGTITDGYTLGNWSSRGSFGETGPCCDLPKLKKVRKLGSTSKKVIASAGQPSYANEAEPLCCSYPNVESKRFDNNLAYQAILQDKGI